MASISMDVLRTIKLDDRNAKPVIDLYIEHCLDKPLTGASGTGYVICSGGKYDRYAYATIRCILKRDEKAYIQVWRGSNEHDKRESLMRGIYLNSLKGGKDGIVLEEFKGSVKGGWPLKSHAVLNCGLENVIFLDSDCLPLLTSEELLGSDAYQKTNSLFFPDIKDCRSTNWVYSHLGIKIKDMPEMEAGQFVVNRKKYWKAIQLYDWFNNDQSEFFYRHLHGDKDLLAFAFKRLGFDFVLGQKPTLEPWGLAHYLPDGTPATSHLIFTKNTPAVYSEEISGYLKEFEELKSVVV